MSANGRGALSDRHPLALQPIAGRLLLPRADAVLAVGTRFVQPATEWGLPAGAPVIQIDADPDEVGRNTRPTIGIVADARAALAALAADLPASSRTDRSADLAAVREHIADLLFEVQPQAAYSAAIRAATPDDGVLITDMTQVGYFARNGYPVYQPRTHLTPGYQGTLGCGFPIALGAQVGLPSRKVVSINGDGGFMFNVQELATMRQHDINAVAVVFNDGAFGNVKRIQQQQFGGRLIASELRNPDFVQLAEVFGIGAMRAATPDALEGALREALATNGPVLIDAPVGEMPGTWFLQSVPVARDWW
jgi:acetolactate synthase-1/2/3 large subunit